MALLTKVFHELFSDEPAAANHHNLQNESPSLSPASRVLVIDRRIHLVATAPGTVPEACCFPVHWSENRSSSGLIAPPPRRRARRRARPGLISPRSRRRV